MRISEISFPCCLLSHQDAKLGRDKSEYPTSEKYHDSTQERPRQGVGLLLGTELDQRCRNGDHIQQRFGDVAVEVGAGGGEAGDVVSEAVVRVGQPAVQV